MVLMFGATAGWSQQGNVPLNRDVHQVYDQYLNGGNVEFHTAIRPYIQAETQAIFNPDTIWPTSVFGFMNTPKDTAINTRIGARVLLNASGGMDLMDKENNSFIGTGIGVGLEAEFGKNIAFYADYRTNNSGYVDYVDTLIQLSHVVPGGGYARGTDWGESYTNYSSYLSFKASEHFSFQLGQGQHFLGDGYRSMMLSDNAVNYPYLRISTDVWKFKYINLYSAYRDYRESNGDPGNFNSKFGTVHYLSYNITPRINVGFFESIVWMGSDTLVDRDFELHYLNPMIFYRPIEFSQGSADNALMGINLKVKVGDNGYLYSQALIDEFLLDSLRSNNGWWANKFSVQGGAKFFDVMEVKGLTAQTEFNLSRPFTYTHHAPTQNYAHFNQPLAHPLGANFYESVNFIRYTKDRITIENQFNYAVFGTDTLSSNFGNNIFESSSTRTRTTGNFIGQGLRNTLYYNHLRASYLVDPTSNLRVELGYIYRHQQNRLYHHNTGYVYFAIRTSLTNQYLDF